MFHKTPFRFVHNLSEHLTVLEANGISLPEDIRLSAELSGYAVEARYPGPMEPVTEDEYKQAIKMAENVVSWVENQIQSETNKSMNEK